MHIFRITISKVRDKCPKSQKHHLLLCFSGGTASRAMLHQQHECLGENRTGKKMFFDVTVLHIDESVLTPGVDMPSSQIPALRAAVERYGFPFVVVPLEEVFVRGTKTRVEGAKELKELLADTNTVTAKEDFVSHIRNELIVSTARKLGISKVLTGETASRLAVNAFSSVAKGRGFNLPSDIELYDKRHDDIVLCRPMKDFLLKELAIYNRYKKLETVDSMNLSTMLPAKSSLNQLSEQFIFGLQEEFPHTVHTVMRSVDKLKTASTPASMLCPLCSGRLSRNEIQAVTVAAQTDKSGGACSSCDCGASTLCTKLPLEQYMCYACKKLLAEGIGKNVPAFVVQRAEAVAAAARSEGLRSKIQEYLLTEDDTEEEPRNVES